MAQATTDVVGLNYTPLDLEDTSYFANWSYRTKLLLCGENCFDLIETERPTANEEGGIPDDETLHNLQQRWDRHNSFAMNLIVRHITSNVIETVRECKSAKEMWDALHQAFQNQSPANQLHICWKLLATKMAEGANLALHFAALENTMSELCQTRMKAVEDNQFMCCILLMSLPPSFDNIVSAITVSSKENLKWNDLKLQLTTHILKKKVTEAATAAGSVSTNNPAVLSFGNQNSPSDPKFKKRKKTTKGGPSQQQNLCGRGQFERNQGSFRSRRGSSGSS